MKVCTRCHVEKPLTEFYSGRSSCKACHKIATDAWKAANHELVLQQEARRRERNREAERERNRTYSSLNRAARSASLARWRSSNPDKNRAQEAVKNALRHGRMTRPDSCSECGATGVRIEAHHDDYSKRLDVRWMCKPCHTVADRERKSRETVGVSDGA